MRRTATAGQPPTHLGPSPSFGRITRTYSTASLESANALRTKSSSIVLSTCCRRQSAGKHESAVEELRVCTHVAHPEDAVVATLTVHDVVDRCRSLDGRRGMEESEAGGRRDGRRMGRTSSQTLLWKRLLHYFYCCCRRRRRRCSPSPLICSVAPRVAPRISRSSVHRTHLPSGLTPAPGLTRSQLHSLTCRSHVDGL